MDIHTRDTSKEAFEKIRDSGLLSKRRMEVYEYVFLKGPCTARETASALSNSKTRPDSFQPRFNELRKMGVFKIVGEKTGEDSGMRQKVWDVTSELPKKLHKDAWMQTIFDMGYETLDDYYASDFWKNFKEGYYLRNPQVCFVSGKSNDLHLHHTTYDRLGRETDSDLVPLHKFWHQFIHRLVKKRKVKLEQAHLVAKECFFCYSIFR